MTGPAPADTYTEHRTYLVHWPDIHTLKIGYTARTDRWRQFINKGATLAQLVEFPTEKLARAYEATVLAYLDYVAEPAFPSRRHAEHLLGASTIGWTECWYLPFPSDIHGLPTPFAGDIKVNRLDPDTQLPVGRCEHRRPA